MPKVSVIVPVYNVEEFLDQCLYSIVNQTFRDLEIIVVDDGSLDRSGYICDEWAEKDPRIKVIHKINGGLSDARNVGLDAATGDYISFVDSDDYIAPDMIRLLMMAISQTGAYIAECNYSSSAENISITVEEELINICEYSTSVALSLLLDNTIFSYTVWNKIYNRNLFNNLRFETGKLHEDVFFTYQVIGACRKLAKIENILYYYRKRADSIMGEPFSLKRLDSLEARKNQYIYIRNLFPELSNKAFKQLLSNCLFFGQQAISVEDLEVRKIAIRQISSIYHESYKKQRIDDSFDHKLWYWIANKNLTLCCYIRNLLKIGI